jgi:hypothetical protein
MRVPTYGQEAYIKVESQRIGLYLSDKSAYGQFSGIRKQISEIKDIVKSNKSKLLVLIIPDELQVNQDLFKEVSSYLGWKDESIEIDLPQKVLKEYLNSENIAYIDLLDSFKKAENPQRYYKVRDTHINYEGNKLAAEELSKAIKDIILKKVLY